MLCWWLCTPRSPLGNPGLQQGEARWGYGVRGLLGITRVRFLSGAALFVAIAPLLKKGFLVEING